MCKFERAQWGAEKSRFEAKAFQMGSVPNFNKKLTFTGSQERSTSGVQRIGSQPRYVSWEFTESKFEQAQWEREKYKFEDKAFQMSFAGAQEVPVSVQSFSKKK